MNYEHTSKLHRLRTLHLFAGAGGGILADILLGHQPVCAVEIEPYCQQVLHARQKDGCLPWFPIFDDVKTFDGKPWRGLVEVVCGGFPCQDISSAGKGAGIGGERSGLWAEMARVVCEVRPRYVFVENSPMLTIRGLGQVLGDLAAMGYDAKWGVLGACDAGAPHKRERIWILANSNVQRTEIGGQHKAAPAFSGYWDDYRNRGINDGSGNFATEENGDMGYSMQRGRASARIQPKRRVSWQGAEASTGTSPRTIDDAVRGWWKAEPGVGRVVDGMADDMDRIAALGNGQVPQCAALAWRTLSEGII